MSAAPLIGFMEDLVRDVTSGKGQLRFLIQPALAMVLGARLGIADAREGAPPFLLRLATASHDRVKIMRRSLSDVVIPLCVSIVLDGIIQHYTLGYVRPVTALLVGMLLVWLPYSLSRAIANRAYRRRHQQAPA